MEERGRACTPAALTMIPRSLPRSLTPSPSSGSHQDSDDLMMRETTLIIHTQQTSPLAVLLSHTGKHTLSNIYRHTHITTHSHSEMHKSRHKTEILALYTHPSVHTVGKKRDACSQKQMQNRTNDTRKPQKTQRSNSYMPPTHTAFPLGQTASVVNFVIICIGSIKALVRFD